MIKRIYERIRLNPGGELHILIEPFTYPNQKGIPFAEKL